MQPGHKYEYQNVNASEGRFAYDGALPIISSKYRKQSVDVYLGKGSARQDIFGLDG